MKIYLIVLTILAITVVFTPVDTYASESGSIYGHISYAEGNPKVIRADKTQEDAIVNLPVAPGDEIITGDKSKCELQFDNGTVMRLGEESRLKVTTVLAQALTSKWKITTLELIEGKLYSINQSYNRERFQIMTPNTAILLKNNSISTIDLREGKTHIFCDRGKFRIMYGGEVKSLKTETVRKGDGFMVTTDHKLVKETKRDIDFLSWNQYIDRNFDKLHLGISKVPKKIYRYPKGVVHWAEKWSSLFGEWVYDDLFGYVWKPADEYFAYSARPFFHAKFTWINNELFLVPSQPWGWIPAHMGTWVWMKWGWTWVPGSAFKAPQYHYRISHYYPTMMGYWMDYIYGGYDLYYTYRIHGCGAWQHAYRERYNHTVRKPSLKNVPDDIRAIIKKLDKAPVASIKERLGKYTATMKRPLPILEKGIKRMTPKLPAKTISPKPIPGVKTVKSTPISIAKKMRLAASTKKSDNKNVKVYRDWNPDKAWSLHKGVKITYSSKTNEVVCRQLGISSNNLTPAKIFALRRSRHHSSKAGNRSNSSGISTGSSSSSSPGALSSTGSRGSSRSGNRGNNGKSNDNGKGGN
jgi:hypothetical protein